MPLFWGALLGALAQGLSSLVGRALVALGIGYVTYSGFSVLLDWLKADIISNVNSLPATILAIVGLLKLDVVISIMFSTYAVKLIVSGVSNGSKTVAKIK